MGRILITGASGYIGRHLISALLARGITVRGYSRSPKPMNNPDLEWYQGDVQKVEDVVQAAKDCESVVHLACRPLTESWRKPQYDLMVNALGTLNVLHAAQTAGVKRVVYTSTAQVYGIAERLPISEDAPCMPVSPYGVSKLCGEMECKLFSRQYGIHIVILRLFNVYGLANSRDERSTVETVFMHRAMKGLAPVINNVRGEGRDFVHLSDVVRAILLALLKSVHTEVINIGTGKMTTLIELADLAIEICDAEVKPVIMEDSVREVVQLQADTRRARIVMNFEPLVELRQGLSWILAGEVY